MAINRGSAARLTTKFESELGGFKRSVGKGECIFAQGEDARDLIFIAQGKVKISAVSPDGKEAIIAILGARSLIGEVCLLARAKRPYSAIALTSAVITRIPRRRIIAKIRDDSELSDLLIRHLLERKIHVEAHLISLLLNSSEARLARLLLQLARSEDDGEGDLITGVNQETLAESVGTTRARVNVFMNKFRKLGLIDYGADIRVSPELATLAYDGFRGVSRTPADAVPEGDVWEPE